MTSQNSTNIKTSAFLELDLSLDLQLDLQTTDKYNYTTGVSNHYEH